MKLHKSNRIEGTELFISECQIKHFWYNMHLTIIKCFGLKVYYHTQGTKQNHENEEVGRQQDYA